MKYFSAIDYQRQLIVAGLDDFSPNATLANYRGGQSGIDSSVWRRAVVEFLCENFKFGLIELTYWEGIRTELDVNKLKDLLLKGDIEKNIDLQTLWNVLYFNGTKRLTNLLEKFELRNWDYVNSEDVCEGFVSYLKNVYSKPE